VLSLEQTKTNQAAKIEKLKKRVKKLKGKKKKRTHGLKRLYKDLFGVHDLDGDEMFVDVTTGKDVEQDATIAKSVKGIAVAITPQISKDELTLAHTLMEIKAAKTKAKGTKDKGKGIMVKLEKPLKKKDQIALDEEVARKLEDEMKAKMDKEEMIAREKNEANRAIIEEWDDVQATIDNDRQRKYFAAKRAEEIKNNPPIKGRQKSLMCTYMNNVEGFKQKDFKGKSFDDIKKMVDNVYKRVNTFVDMNTKNVEESLKKTQAEVTEGSSKRAGQKLEQESAKKHKLV
nr:hypothetical protein [Tanacetum cinerariifolium]